MSTVWVGDEPLDLWDIERIALGMPVAITNEALHKVRQGQHQLDVMIRERRLIYGVTTGYGPLAGRYIDPSKAGELQRNLIYHLASGTGPKLERVAVRAIMAVRLNTLTQGHSAVSPAALETLVQWLNADIVPVVPSRGTVGASGDLTPLAHIALALMGEADVCDNGSRRTATDALAERGWMPLNPVAKDALGLVNGTAAMTGIAALNGCAAYRSLDLALRCTVGYAECLQGRIEAWHSKFGELRPHPGQQEVHRRLLSLAQGSKRLIARSPGYLPDNMDSATPVHNSNAIPQDPYTIRCAPQLFGAVLDVIDWHNTTINREINAITDNPLFESEEESVFHGGNFYGQHVAFASDALGNALVKLAIHNERLVARLTDENQNGLLPAFLQGCDTGLHSGLMGVQVSASALIGELRTLAQPASIQSVPTNANNQDVVTMGTIAARKTANMLVLIHELQAITGITVAQAMDLIGIDEFSPDSALLHAHVRQYSAPITTDRPMYRDIEQLALALQDRVVIGPLA